jgi:NADH dehydrogenase
MGFRHPAATRGAKIVVVIGAGFGGLNVAKGLARNPNTFVILIDQRNYHLFQPLLYQVATAGLNAEDIAVPVRAQFGPKDNVQVHLGRVSKVDLNQKFVRVEESGRRVDLEFDYVVLACGAQHSYFGHQDWEPYAPGLKTLEQAKDIRRKILLAFEHAENELDPKVQEQLLTFVVVGGGPTGVELAGAIADISRTVLVNDFKRIDSSSAKVLLIEAGPRVLPSFSEDLSDRALKDLQYLGVDVRLNSRVEHIDDEGVVVNGQRIPAKSVFWAAGVQAQSVDISPRPETDRAGRIIARPDCSLSDFPYAFVIGDMASITMADGKQVPGLAPAAVQAGKHTAKMISRLVKGKSTLPFRYLDKGELATIGRNRAVMQTGAVKVTGRLAWLAWLFIHVFYLVGFKNRVSVMYTWVWSYLRRKRGSRVIDEARCGSS